MSDLIQSLNPSLWLTRRGVSTITSTWTEAEREAVMAQWRVTRKVAWPDLEPSWEGVE